MCGILAVFLGVYVEDKRCSAVFFYKFTSNELEIMLLLNKAYLNDCNENLIIY